MWHNSAFHYPLSNRRASIYLTKTLLLIYVSTKNIAVRGFIDLFIPVSNKCCENLKQMNYFSNKIAKNSMFLSLQKLRKIVNFPILHQTFERDVV